ncbi:MAG TPA: SipW-dependent-type signal peptide-containing protein [Symbiobacteriaceae bacterium]|nr:SipW-dependent-type signal peptide-containing protein [Symbiobacteriaceae bacterium]
MKKKLLLVSSAFVTTLALVAGVSLALFTDDVSNSGNSFVAGELCLDTVRDRSDPTPGPLFYTTRVEGATYDAANPPAPQDLGLFPHEWETLPDGRPWAPGDYDDAILDVHNCADLGLYLDTLSIGDYVITKPDGTPGSADYLDYFTLTVEADMPNGTKKVVAQGSFTDFLAGKELRWFTGTPPALTQRWYYVAHGGANHHLYFHVELDRGMGNAFQGYSLVARFDISSVQSKHNCKPSQIPGCPAD